MNEEFPDEIEFPEPDFAELEARIIALTARKPRILIVGDCASAGIMKLLNALQPKFHAVVVDARSETKLPDHPDLASIAEEYTDMKNTRMGALMGHAMAAAFLMGRSAIPGGGHVEAKTKRGRQLASHGHYTYTKPNGPTGPGIQRLKQKAKGVATAKARGCYRSAKKK